MRKGPLGWVLCIATAATMVGCGPRQAEISYRNDVEPILTAKCSGCHASGQEGFVASGLDTTHYAALMRGGRHGKLVEPGDEFASTRRLVSSGDSHARRLLSEEEFAILKVWICEGAKDN